MRVLLLTKVFFILLILSSCLDDASSPLSEVKNLLQTEGGNSKFYTQHSDEFLVNHIFESEWDVAYYVQPECNFNAEQLLEIEAAIEGSIRRWFQWLTGTGRKVPAGHPPGYENSTVVDNFNLINVTNDYELVNKIRKHRGEEAVRKQGVTIIKNLFTVFFYCGTDSSVLGRPNGAYYTMSGVSRGDGTWFHENTIHIFIPSLTLSSPSQAGSGASSCWYDIGDTGFNRFTLLHEMGHAMGLADTYFLENYNEDYDKKVRQKFNLPARTSNDPRRIMNEHRPGEYQPPSLMSCGYLYNPPNKPYDGKKTPMLYTDDVLGIIRAYEVMVLGEQD